MNIQQQIEKAAVLIEALPYIQGFNGQRFLIKIGGSAMEDPDLVNELLRDIVFLKTVGIHPIIVHGGGKAISRAMEEVGLTARFVGGLRVTDREAVEVVEKTLSTVINPRIVSGIEAAGGRARGIPGHHVLRAERIQGIHPETGKPVDLGHVGRVVGCDRDAIETDLERSVAVISPIARDIASGDFLNINADIAAAAIAPRLGVAKLIYLSDVLGVLRDPGRPETLIHSLNRAQADEAITSGIITGGMIPKVESALGAIEAGVGKVHLIDGRIPHSVLLEIFTTEGVGTEIVRTAKSAEPRP